MENLIVANQASIFSLFGWGFLAGSIFAFAVILAFEWLTNMRKIENR